MHEFSNIARAASRRYWWPGADREDVEQEALYALVRHNPSTPGLAKAIVNRHLIDCVRRECSRRPQFAQEIETEDPRDVPAMVEARERLRLIFSLSPAEQRAIGRVVRGEPIRRSEGALGIALWRARRRLREAA